MSTTIEKLNTEAEAAVDDLEAVAPGDVFAEPLATAEQSVEELHASATATLFPPNPAPADPVVIADFEKVIAGGHSSDVPRRLADLHRRSVRSYEALASLCRGWRGVGAVRASATNPMVEGNSEAASVEVYQRQCASHLLDVEEFEPSATIIAATVPSLQRRVASAKQVHEAHAAAELERVEAEEREVEAAMDRQRHSDRQEAEQAVEEARRESSRAELMARRARGAEIAAKLERLAGDRAHVYVALDRSGRGTYAVSQLVGRLRGGRLDDAGMAALEATLDDRAIKPRGSSIPVSV